MFKITDLEMTVIHISCDYPDSHVFAKTRAISNLVEATNADFHHHVYSLNRLPLSPLNGLKNWISGGWPIIEFDGVLASSDWGYHAPSHGLFMKSSLYALSDRLSEDIVKKGLKPELIQGHKLSIEGLIAQKIAQNFNIPFAISIQGNSDRSILQIRRDLWPIYRTIFHDAAAVFPFAPWALDYCEQVLGKRAGKTIMLPCIGSSENIIAPKINHDAKIMSAFHLRHWKLKNFDRLAQAAQKAAADEIGDEAGDGKRLSLDIYGGGEDALVAMLEKRIEAMRDVNLCGPIKPSIIQEKMNDSTAFAMVSNKESYGMVFAESLLAGCPIIYPKDAAVDGYFNGYSFAQAVPADDVGAIADAMQKAVRDQERMKDDLYAWQISDAPRNFQRNTIVKNYRDGLHSALLVN